MSHRMTTPDTRFRRHGRGWLALGLVIAAGCSSGHGGGAGGGDGTLVRGQGGASGVAGKVGTAAGGAGGAPGGSGIADGGAPDATTAPTPACGGSIHTTSTGKYALDAHYVDLRYQGGDCSEVLTLVIAATVPDDSLTITMPIAINRSTRSFVGRSTVVASFQDPDGTMPETGADVEITAFPANAVNGADGGGGVVTGTFSISSGGSTIEGSFASPVCSSAICI